MADERWERIKRLMAVAAGLGPADRAALLAGLGDAQLRADVEELLRADEADSFFDHPPIADLLETPYEKGDSHVGAGDATPPERIGSYRVVRLVGEGGMGLVYEAQQEQPVRRRVAVKLIKFGMDTKQVIARFESERQALALMNHPTIASVYDAGATNEGRPYFAMEYVQGIPITEYCDKHRVTIRERLELFTRVCDGIQHAHQKGIIHRDLKPSNVLVAIYDDAPIPKIIDFGVAKATSQRLSEKSIYTERGQLIGTPEYMSPEQAEMTNLDIDTRTDVYSLGVLLYELLVGFRPFDRTELRKVGLFEIQRRLREEEPPKPSSRVNALGSKSDAAAANRRLDARTLMNELRGDLDWIVMKSLEKDRTARYGSPSELAADVRRHLEDEPVSAGPPTASYRVRKFIKRHRVGVSAAGIVIAALLLGIVGTTFGFIRARRAEIQAGREAETANQVSEFLVSMFRSAAPTRAQGEDISAKEVLDQGRERIRDELAGQPGVRARLLQTLGEVYAELGAYEAAGDLLGEAVEMYRQSPQENGVPLVETLRALGWSESDRGDDARAEELFQEALSLARNLDNQEQIAFALMDMGILMKQQGRYAQAEPMYEQSIAIARTLYGNENEEMGTSLNNLAILKEAMGNYAAAEPLYREALSIYRNVLGENHPAVAIALNNIGVFYSKTGNFAESENTLRESLALRRKLLGEEHPDVALTMNNLAITLSRAGSYGAAKDLFIDTLAMRQKLLGEEHVHIANTMLGLANAEARLGDLDSAERWNEAATLMWRHLLGDEHPLVATSLHQRAVLFRQRGDLESAEQLFQKVLDLRTALLGPEHPEIAETLVDLGLVELNKDAPLQAEALMARAISMQRTLLHDSHPDLGRSLNRMAAIQVALGKHADALVSLNEAESILSKTFDDRHPERALSNCVRGVYRIDDPVAAKKALAECPF